MLRLILFVILTNSRYSSRGRPFSFPNFERAALCCMPPVFAVKYALEWWLFIQKEMESSWWVLQIQHSSRESYYFLLLLNIVKKGMLENENEHMREKTYTSETSKLSINLHVFPSEFFCKKTKRKNLLSRKDFSSFVKTTHASFKNDEFPFKSQKG